MDKFVIVKDGSAVQRVRTATDAKYYTDLWRQDWPDSTFTIDCIED